MTITITPTLILYLLLLIALVAAVAYLYGDWRGSRSPEFQMPAPAPVIIQAEPVEVDPYADVPTEIIPVTVEQVAYLDATGPVPVPTTVAPAWHEPAAVRLAAENLELALERDALAARIAHLEAVALWKDRLRARYLRLLRVERARVKAVFGDVWQRPRKPRLKQLAQEVVSIGTPAHPATIRLVPPLMMKELEAAA